VATEFQYDVYLSHNQADKPQVRSLELFSRPSTLNHQPICLRRLPIEIGGNT
jgi:hypothetical protein